MSKESQDSNHFRKEEFIIRPVGYVKSKIKDPSLKARDKDIEMDKDIKRTVKENSAIRELVSEIFIDPALDGILEGLEDFSHALILYWPHLLPASGRSLTKVHPMGRKEFPLRGVFSTCSPARPNPILVTVVQVVERKVNVLKVRGLEAVDGSPVIDIKPYTMTYLAAEDVKLSDWMESIQKAMSRD